MMIFNVDLQKFRPYKNQFHIFMLKITNFCFLQLFDEG